MNSMSVTMRGLYKRGMIYWIAYKALGHVVRESTGTPDRKLAEAVLSKRRAEVFEGRWSGRLRDTQTPIRQAIQEFLAVYSKPRKVSWKEDQLVLERFATYLGPNACLQDVDRRVIERFQLQLLSQGMSKARLNRYTAALKCFFNRFIDWNKLSTNPCRGIKLYPEMPRTHWLEAGQITQLLEHASLRLRPLVQVALLTGLRRGDILRLTWDRIDFEEGLLRIIQGKTQTPLLLPMSEALADVLRGIRRDMDSPYVFGRHGRSVCRYGWVRTDFAKTIQAAGLAGTRFHDLRHTVATQLRRLGRDLQVVQQLLGHKTIRTTMRYSHVHPTELREAVNRLGEKIMPKDPAHFTITSQSPVSDHGSDCAPSKNEARLQSETISRDSGMGGMPKTVKQEHAPSEGAKRTTFRRAGESRPQQQ
jgi:integrase